VNVEELSIPKKATVVIQKEAETIAGSAGLPIPLYEHVKNLIAEAIIAGDIPSGTVLPGEVAMAQQYAVSVGTIRRALTDLTVDGMLVRRRKTGTVVTGRAPQHSLKFFFQYFRLHDKNGGLLRSETQVLSVARRPADAREAAQFSIDHGEPVIELHRVRAVDGTPVMHARTVMVEKRLPGFPQDVAIPPLLYRHLLDAYGIRISAVRESLTAEIATDEDRRILALPDLAAILAIHEEAYDQTGALTILSAHRATTAQHVYLNEIR
jgi:GntR family transcriptional regulator